MGCLLFAKLLPGISAAADWFGHFGNLGLLVSEPHDPFLVFVESHLANQLESSRQLHPVYSSL